MNHSDTPAAHSTLPPAILPSLVGIDVGGTFTDFVVLEDGELRVYKVPTTPHDQSEAIAAGLDDLAIDKATIVHGMTVATNALLERKGARTALLATAGFADVLTIGRQNRPHIYQLSQTRPAPLVEASLRFEVPERINADGTVHTPLDLHALDAIVAQLATQQATGQVESVALAFLFAFRRPDHEAQAAAHLRQALPHLPLSLSSEILPEYREYERTATTVINAYVLPLVSRYLQRLAARLGLTLASETLAPDAAPQPSTSTPRREIRIMQSNGGAMGLEQAAAQSARLVLSGPAGGVVGAFAVARQAQAGKPPHIITFDMGGTSTDVALCPGQIPTTAEGTITDLPLRLPIIDIHTVGAGGGSIAHVDVGGALRVGPHSAGAQPGPACYGRGGTEPTVTDANLVLGRLDATGFLGGHGQVQLDATAATRALTDLGAPLGMNAVEAALGVVRVANATMERALRQVSVERGRDPRGFALVPFGGAGPLHACELAQALGITRIFVPPMPGVLSAYGMLVADIVHDLTQSILMPLDELRTDSAPLQKAYAHLAHEVTRVLQTEKVHAPQLDTALDLRYRGQSYELTVPTAIPTSGPWTAESLDATARAFHAAHEQRYGYAMPHETVEVVNLRVRGHGPGAEAQLPRLETPAVTTGDQTDAPAQGQTEIWFSPMEPTPTPVYARSQLRPHYRFGGPALVLQYDATLLVTPGWHAHVDEFANLWLEKPTSDTPSDTSDTPDKGSRS